MRGVENLVSYLEERRVERKEWCGLRGEGVEERLRGEEGVERLRRYVISCIDRA